MPQIPSITDLETRRRALVLDTETQRLQLSRSSEELQRTLNPIQTVTRLSRQAAPWIAVAQKVSSLIPVRQAPATRTVRAPVSPKTATTPTPAAPRSRVSRLRRRALQGVAIGLVASAAWLWIKAGRSGG